MKIVSVEEMRALEARSEAAGVSTEELMQRAGLAVAREVRRLLGGTAGARIAVLVGPGNNGGDGLVAARHLADWRARVQVYLLAPRAPEDANLAAVDERGVLVQEGVGDLQTYLGAADTVLDAVLGTGRSRPLGGAFKEAFEVVRRERARRPTLKTVALDIPSGLDADSGAVDPAAFPADVTITLGFPKQGLYRGAGPAAAGRVAVVDIGIPGEDAGAVSLELMTAEGVRSILPRRPADANKGTFGRALVVAGSGSFIGAAVLTCRGALRAGAGLVTLAAPAPLVAMVAGSLVEATYIPLRATPSGAIAKEAAEELRTRLDEYDAVAVGCGLGQEAETRAFLEGLLLGGGQGPALREGVPVVLDADALNILASMDGWWKRLQARGVLTPHPGEMARLAKESIAEVQDDRVASTRKEARTWNQTVVLKGAHTVVARPDGLTRISPFAVPALASGGTGDVLTGIIAGLMAQGVEPFNAATAGVYLHGRAGERFTELHGDTGLIASDLPALLPDVIRELRGPSP